MTFHRAYPFSQWVISVLEGSDLTVGYMKKPTDANEVKGYVVIYPIAGGSTSGSLNAPYEDATPDMQFTCTSFDPGQAEDLRDRVLEAMLGAWPATLSDGRKVVFVDVSFGGDTATREPDVDPPRFFVPACLTFRTAS